MIEKGDTHAWIPLDHVPVKVLDQNREELVYAICRDCDAATLQRNGVIIDLSEYQRQPHKFLGPIIYTPQSEETSEDIAA